MHAVRSASVQPLTVYLQGSPDPLNSAALRFIPAAELAAQGYGEYQPLFEAADTTSTEEHAS